MKRLKLAKVRLKAVAMDMSEAYAKAVRQVFGDKVDIVHDTFHVVALASKAIDDTRRDMVRKPEGEERQVIKGTRFLLLRSKENLTDDGMTRLMKLMATNEPLYQVYLLKEDVRTFWRLPCEAAGKASLDTHRPGLPAYLRHSISTAKLEGTKNKIKVLKRQAYGFRDMAFFKLRLYLLQERSIMLPG